MKYRTESALQAAIIRALRSRGFWVVRRGYKSRRSNIAPVAGEPGEGDVEVRPFGHIEIKLPGEGLTPAQVTWHRAAKELGLRVEIAESVQEAVEIAERWMRESGLTWAKLFRVRSILERAKARRKAA